MTTSEAPMTTSNDNLKSLRNLDNDNHDNRIAAPNTCGARAYGNVVSRLSWLSWLS